MTLKEFKEILHFDIKLNVFLLKNGRDYGTLLGKYEISEIGDDKLKLFGHIDISSNGKEIDVYVVKEA